MKSLLKEKYTTYFNLQNLFKMIHLFCLTIKL